MLYLITISLDSFNMEVSPSFIFMLEVLMIRGQLFCSMSLELPVAPPTGYRLCIFSKNVIVMLCFSYCILSGNMQFLYVPLLVMLMLIIGIKCHLARFLHCKVASFPFPIHNYVVERYCDLIYNLFLIKLSPIVSASVLG